MTIRTPEGTPLTDQDFGIAADPRAFSAQDQIIHLLGLDPCFDIVVSPGSIETRDVHGEVTKLRDAVSHVLPPGPTRAFHVVVQTVENRLNNARVAEGAGVVDHG